MIEGQGIGDQSPNLALQDGLTVKDQQGIKQSVLGDLSHEIHQSAAKADIKHQIGDALAAVLKAETVKSSA